jgi:imidazole glycerol-phosphate synthase subunit HisH
MDLVLFETLIRETCIMKLSIVDYGVGNLRSVQRMFYAIGTDSEIISSPDQALHTDKLVLPGVGAFDSGMKAIHDSGWFEVLNHLALEKKIPTLGICLGMQLLCRQSEEGQRSGLGWIAADVVKFKSEGLNLKIPHMGWSVVTPVRENPILPLDLDEQRFYHVHKYHAVCDDESSVFGRTEYGYEFASAIQKDNIYGVQFHPEKSHKFGMSLLKRFSDL